MNQIRLRAQGHFVRPDCQGNRNRSGANRTIPSRRAQVDETCLSTAPRDQFIAPLDTAALANERYDRGLSNYLDVVDAQRAALQAERQETQIRGQQAISTIFLAKALGGGWEGHSAQPRLAAN